MIDPKIQGKVAIISGANHGIGAATAKMLAAQELGKYGITVNVVCPGANQTAYITAENEKWIVEKTPLGRLGQPEDVANVITLLVSDQGGWLTGNLLYASGGFLTFMGE